MYSLIENADRQLIRSGDALFKEKLLQKSISMFLC